MVLGDGVASGRGSIEADPRVVGAVVVNRCPVGASGVDPRTGAMVVPLGHQMMQTERRHVVHDRFAGCKHHGFHRRDEPGIVGEGQSQPIVGDFIGAKRVVPGQSSEREPVGLRERVAAPVAIGPDVRDTRHARDDFGDRGVRTGRVGIRHQILLEQGARYARCVPWPRYSCVI